MHFLSRPLFLAALTTLALALVSISGLALFPRLAHAQLSALKQHGKLPITTLTIGLYSVQAEVASREADRQQGLMHRTSLGPNDGMLFIFDENAQHCFWMKNTPLALSIAFINESGIITDITEMKPETTQNHCPQHAGRYALEMNQGWFAAKGIKPGMAMGGLPLWQETSR
ncbi:DUF192 domain-containing protein [Mycoavidus sp. B2-EB]|uniref:DUF192 domain-containing protein n=1 Tax=Mycoavidus sp. B2-EB TaxID=2651972 RepID=UPI001E5624EE|nr:DUF192 domain-containing protein [Mycoavidus sp. B2-EB]BBO60384.1 hypothetical protein MPB2EB_1525 [Mycoavidus sp. B2-EB]